MERCIYNTPRGSFVTVTSYAGVDCAAFFWRAADAENWDPLHPPAPEAFQVSPGCFFAYDPARFDACDDPECRCRQARGNSRGSGATAAEAFAEFWEQWEERSSQ